MKIINTKDTNFKAEFDAILARANSDIKDVSTIVMNIIEEIVKEPCKHEPYIKYSEHGEGVYPKYASCEKCGVGLVAEWKEKK